MTIPETVWTAVVYSAYVRKFAAAIASVVAIAETVPASIWLFPVAAAAAAAGVVAVVAVAYQ
jgi:hypothetical protein